MLKELKYDQSDALETFLTTFDGDVLHDIGPALTCSEAEALADVFVTFGYQDAADALIESHSDSDDEGDAHWTGEEEV